MPQQINGNLFNLRRNYARQAPFPSLTLDPSAPPGQTLQDQIREKLARGRIRGDGGVNAINIRDPFGQGSIQPWNPSDGPYRHNPEQGPVTLPNRITPPGAEIPNPMVLLSNPINNDHGVRRPRPSAYDPNRQKPADIPQALWDQSRQQAAQDNAFAQRAANPAQAAYEGGPPASAYDPNRQKPADIPQALWDQSRQQAAQDNAFAQRTAAYQPEAPYQMPSVGRTSPAVPFQPNMGTMLASSLGRAVSEGQQALNSGMGYTPPGAQVSSSQAGLAAGNTPVGPDGMDPRDARRVNGYAGMQSPLMGPEESYRVAQQAALDNSRYNNPMGDEARFSQGSAMMSQANAIAAGRASSTGPNATTYELPQGYGKVPVYNPLRPAPEVQYRDNGRGQQVSYIPQNGPGIDPVLARQNAALKNRGSEAWQADRRQKAENRRERRATEKSRRDEVKFKHMVSRGMNPMSPQAKALFPGQTGGLTGAGPDLKDTPFAPNAPLTPDNARKAKTMQSNMLGGYTDAAGNQHPPEPLWPAIGVEPGASIRDVHFGLYDYLNGGSDLSPADLNSLHQYAVLERQNAVDGEDPFKISRWYSMAEGWGEESARAHDSVYAPLWRELSEIPVGAPPGVLQAWEKKYREAQKAVRDKAQTPSGHNNPARMSQS